MYPGLKEQRAIRTMMYDSIEPLTPMREPTVVNNGLSSMKPMNHQAPIILVHIMKKMKRIISQTFGNKGKTRVRVQYGDDDSCHSSSILKHVPVHDAHENVRMSAPPTAAVSVYPFIKLSSVFRPRYPAATAGTAGAAAKNPPIAARFTPSKEPLIRCRAGSMRGLDDIFPASLRNATIDPVNVTPPPP